MTARRPGAPRPRPAQESALRDPPRLRVFVTGATGYLGGAIAARLARAGHEITALVRSPDRAAAAAARSGDAGDLEALLVPLRNCDAVVHAAVDPRDREGFDARILDAVRLAAQDGRVRRFLYTSGVWVHGDTGGAIADERSPLAAPELVRWRPAHENRALDLDEHEVRVAILRPGIVYGGAGGIFGDWFAEARAHGTVTWPGSGEQHWATVHRDDVATGYLQALTVEPAGERYLLVDDSRFTVRELAEAAARAAGAAAVASGGERPRGMDRLHFAAMLMDQRLTAARARQALVWRPAHASFVAAAGALWREWRGGS